MSEFQLPIRVYIEDTDAGGIVYYVNYLKYIERSRTELLRSLGYGKTAILENGLLLVVRSAAIDYLSPARLDDELVATAKIKKLANSYVVFEQQVRRGSDVLCHGEVKVACVRQQQGLVKPVRLPEDIAQAITGYGLSSR